MPEQSRLNNSNHNTRNPLLIEPKQSELPVSISGPGAHGWERKWEPKCLTVESLKVIDLAKWSIQHSDVLFNQALVKCSCLPPVLSEQPLHHLLHLQLGVLFVLGLNLKQSCEKSNLAKEIWEHHYPALITLSAFWLSSQTMSLSLTYAGSVARSASLWPKDW